MIIIIDISMIQFRKKSDWISIVLIGGFAFIYNNQIIIIVNSVEICYYINKYLIVNALVIVINCMNVEIYKWEKIEISNFFKRVRVCYNIILLIMSKYQGPRVRIIRRFGVLIRFILKLTKFIT